MTDRTATSASTAQTVKQDSTPTAPTRWSARHVILESIKRKKEKQRVFLACLESMDAMIAQAVTNVQMAQHQISLVLPPRAQHVQREEHKKEKETRPAALVLLENFKRRTQTMKYFARSVELDSSLMALTRQSARHVI